MKNLKIFIFTMLFFFSSLAFSEPFIKLATGNNYFPFADENLKSGGLFTEIVEAIIKSVDMTPSVEFMTWNRAQALTKSGKYMGTFPFMKTEERQADFKFSDTVFVVDSHIVVSSDSKLEFNKLDDIENLKGKIFCKPKGYGLEKFVQKLVNKKYIFQRTTDSMEVCVHLLLKNKIDFIVEAPIILNQLLYRDKIDKNNFKILTPVIQQSELRLMVTKQNKDAQGNDVGAFLTKFNLGIVKLHNNNTIQKIIDSF